MASITKPEADALQALLTRTGQEDPMAVVIREVTASIRNDIRSYADNRLSTDESQLPEGAVSYAVAIIRFELITRIPGGGGGGGRAGAPLMNDDRRASYKSAMEWLKEVRRGIAKIERYDEPTESTAPVAGPGICSRGRQFTRRSQDGI